VSDPRRGDAETFCRAVIHGDVDFVAQLDDADAPWFAATIGACFVALVRTRLQSADDAAIARAALAPALIDAEDRRIPPWIVEAMIRMALGELNVAEGVSPQALFDTQLTYVREITVGMSEAERDELVDRAVETILESGVPRRGSAF
jgi:hypothetical protein